jgi:chromosome segregation ATPase
MILAAEESVFLGLGDTAVASILAAVVAGLVGWLTARANKKAQVAAAEATAKAAVAGQELHSRTDIERDAFERAKGYYTDAMDRQGAEITSLEASEVDLKMRLNTLERERQSDRERIDILDSRVRVLERENEELRSKLAVATTLLEQKYPNE